MNDSNKILLSSLIEDCRRAMDDTEKRRTSTRLCTTLKSLASIEKDPKEQMLLLERAEEYGEQYSSNREKTHIIEERTEFETGAKKMRVTEIPMISEGDISSSHLRDLLQTIISNEVDGRVENLLLYGPPGTGKTTIALQVSTALGMPLYSVTASSLLSKWVGTSSKILASVYEQARNENRRAIVLIDDCEALSSARSEDNPSGNSIIATFLDELDGISAKTAKNQPLTIFTSNLPELIDGGILDRAPIRKFVDLPDAGQIKQLLQTLAEQNGLELAISAQVIATKAANQRFSYREVNKLISAAKKHMVLDLNPDFDIHYRELSEDERKNFRLIKRPLCDRDFDEAFKMIHSLLDTNYRGKYKHMMRGEN